MSDDVDVIMEEDPLVPQVSRHPKGVGEALVLNFLDRDPYTRRHRSRSMADINLPMPEPATPTLSNGAVGNGVGSNGQSNNGVPVVPRVMSAEA